VPRLAAMDTAPVAHVCVLVDLLLYFALISILAARSVNMTLSLHGDHMMSFKRLGRRKEFALGGCHADFVFPVTRF
jgi:hypothetical protein